MNNSNPKILLAAGGTGGHIYPALALGEAIRATQPNAEIRYVCGSRPGEIAIYKSAGIDPIILSLSGRRRGITNMIQFARELIASTLQARREVRAFRPAIAVGFGNYISVPVLWAARGIGAKTAIHEQNAYPGAANRWLARGANLVLTGIETPPGVFPADRTRLVGNPVRADLLKPHDRAAARRELGLPTDAPICLWFGGSLGAQNVNRLLMETLQRIFPNPVAPPNAICESDAASSDASSQWHFLWGAGRQLHDECRRWLDQHPALAARVTLKAYLDRMDLAYAAADLVVARAGALTLAELTALGKPSILIPLPHSAGDHQRGNARTLERAGAGRVVEEADAQAAEKLANSIKEFGAANDTLSVMSRNALALGRPHAAKEMAEAVLGLIQM